MGRLERRCPGVDVRAHGTVAVGWARAGNSDRAREMLVPWPERYPDPAPKDWEPFARACIRVGDLPPAIRCFEQYRARAAPVQNTQYRAGAYRIVVEGWVFAAIVAGHARFLATAEDIANEMMTFTEITHDGMRPLRAFCDLALGYNMFGNAAKASDAMARAEDLREVLLTTDRVGLAWERMRRTAEIGKAWAALGSPDQSLQKYHIAVETAAGESASPAALGQAVHSLGQALELVWWHRWVARRGRPSVP